MLALLAMQQTSLTAAMEVNLEQSFKVDNGNVLQITSQPARRVAAPVVVDDGGGGETAVGAGNDLTMIATLMPTPRSLHDLWHEYLHGVGGRMPARLGAPGGVVFHTCHPEIA